MVNFCCVNGCKAECYPGCGLSFHRLPKDESVAAKWKAIIPGKITKTSVICNKHFKDDDFINISKQRITGSAVPSIFPKPQEASGFENIILIPNASSMKNTVPPPTLTSQGVGTLPICALKTVIKICRVCMTETALKPVLKNLESSFLDITGIHLYHRMLKADLPLVLCNRCWDDFYKCLAFRENARRANADLYALKSDGKLSIDNIKRLVSTEDNTEEPAVKEETFTIFTSSAQALDYSDQEGQYCDQIKVKLEICKEEEKAKILPEETLFENKFLKEPHKDETPEPNNELDLYYAWSEEHSASETDDIPAKKLKEKPARGRTKKAQALVEERNVDELVANERKDVPRSGKGSSSENIEIIRNIEKWFTVCKLTADEQHEEFEKRKQKKRYLMSRFKCEYCYNGFSSEAVYAKHMEKHKESPELPFACPLCHHRYPLKRRLNKHLPCHQKLYRCRSCEYITDNGSMAIRHVHWHRGKDYHCKDCPGVFKKLGSLTNHVRIKHPSDHVCSLCGYSFVGDKGLAAHRKLKHEGQDLTIPETGALCIECNICFLNEDALDVHRAVSLKHENNGRRVLNNASQRRSIEYTTLTAGLRQKLREQLRPVDCEKCGVTLRSYREYQKHFSQHHPNDTRTQLSHKNTPGLCDLCGKTFKKTYALQQHMNEHTRAVIHQCEHCDKTFANRLKLNAHRVTHSSAGYSCPICHMTFKHPSNCRRHVKFAHTNERNVKCPLCEKCFKSEPELKLHTDHVHLRKPRPKRFRTKRKDAIGGIDCKRKKESNLLVGDDTSSS